MAASCEQDQIISCLRQGPTTWAGDKDGRQASFKDKSTEVDALDLPVYLGEKIGNVITLHGFILQNPHRIPPGRFENPVIFLDIANPEIKITGLLEPGNESFIGNLTNKNNMLKL